MGIDVHLGAPAAVRFDIAHGVPGTRDRVHGEIAVGGGRATVGQRDAAGDKRRCATNKDPIAGAGGECRIVASDEIEADV